MRRLLRFYESIASPLAILVLLIVLIPGCNCTGVSKESFRQYLEADRAKLKSMQIYFQQLEDTAEEKELPLSASIRLKLLSMKSWKARIDKAEKGLKDDRP